MVNDSFNDDLLYNHVDDGWVIMVDDVCLLAKNAEV